MSVVVAAPPQQELRRPELAAWMLLCAAAETVGMTAAAAAAHGADALLTHPATWRVTLAWAAVLAAGSTEALAVGLAQSRALRRRWPDLRARRFVVVTVVVAALTWAAGSLPSLGATSSGAAADTAPPWLLVVAGGALLGAFSGAVLGASQAWVLPRRLRSRSVWVLGGAVAWTPAMTVILVGASTPSASWPLATVLAWASLTGAVAGALLGLVLGLFSPSLDGMPLSRRVVLGMLRHGHPRRLRRGMLGLRVTGRVTGTPYELPVMYVEHDGDRWIAVGRSSRKTWWRNVGEGTAVEVLDHGRWHEAVADLVPPTDRRFLNGFAWYLARWPRASLALEDPMIRLRGGSRHAPVTPDHPYDEELRA